MLLQAQAIIEDEDATDEQKKNATEIKEYIENINNISALLSSGDQTVLMSAIQLMIPLLFTGIHSHFLPKKSGHFG